MIDYSFKSQVLTAELDVLQKYVSQSIFYHKFPNFDVQPHFPYQLAIQIEQYYLLHYNKQWQEAIKINHALYERNKRLKHFIRFLLKRGRCLFLTFTFSEDSLKNTSALTRKRYVTRYLKRYSEFYVANKDFGGENGREHYHAIILCDLVNHEDWHCGALNFEVCRTSNKDCNCVSMYTAKMTNHAIKETTKRSALIYSRSSVKLETESQFKEITKVIHVRGKFKRVKPIELPFNTPFIYQEKIDFDELFD